MSMETIFMNTVNSKKNEPHIFVSNLTQIRLYLIRQTCSSSKMIYLLHVEKYKKTVKKTTTTTTKKQLKIIVPTWNDEFQLPDSSYSVSRLLKIILDILLKSMNHQQQFLLLMFTSIEFIID